jgi:serpin B
MGLRESLRVGASGLLFGMLMSSSGCGGGSSSQSVSPPPNSAPSTSAPPAVLKAYAAGSVVNPSLVTADNDLGLNLLNTLLASNTGNENVAIAPVSVAIALQVVYNGAKGASQQAMDQTLQLGAMSTDDLNAANAALQASLLNPDPNVHITLANSLWLHLADNPVNPNFTQTDTTYYGATVGDLSGAPDNINAWVAAQTHGLITAILPPESPNYYRSVIAFIANVVYFKGPWTTAFPVDQTVQTPFTRSDGTQVASQMMNQTGTFGYLRGSNFQALRLPYGQGVLSMLIVLPDTGVDLDSLMAGLSGTTVSGWVAGLQDTVVDVGLPRFTATFSATLVPALSSLGMGAAFCPSPQVDFSGIAPLACISDVEHETLVQVDESGTVAAGASGVTVGTGAVELSVPMTMNHPFLYFIRDDATGALLFAGVLRDPTAT